MTEIHDRKRAREDNKMEKEEEIKKMRKNKDILRETSKKQPLENSSLWETAKVVREGNKTRLEKLTIRYPLHVLFGGV